MIWTTIATGVRPEVHGITDFVVPTPQGDAPVSSRLRRAPALWNMATVAGRRVAVVGWWASWPAEEVAGVVISDRALFDVPDRVHPPALLPRFEAWVAEADGMENPFRGNEIAARRDQVTALAARRLLEGDESFDLVLVYFRSVDVASHNHWRAFEPEAFGLDPAEVGAEAEEIPRAYEAVDRALGEIAAAAPDANLLVISDHGFRAAAAEEVQVWLDFDEVLERLGHLAREPQGVDFAASRFYSYASPLHRRRKLVRFSLEGREPGGRVEPAGRAAARRRLEADLARVTYESGAPAFRVREAQGRERRRGADFVVVVLPEAPSRTLLVDGEPFDGAVRHLGSISGTHTLNTHGILIAAGPDVDPGAELDGIRIHDVAPTLLFGLGLPVAEDFPGRAWQRLFTPEFRRHHRLATIASWGRWEGEEAATSAADEELLDELRALGYFD